MDGLGGFEVEQSRSIRAFRDVLASVVHRAVGLIRALAEVQHMDVEEIGQIQRLSNIGAYIAYEAVEVPLDVIDEVVEETAVAIGSVENTRVTDSRYVELASC